MVLYLAGSIEQNFFFFNFLVLFADNEGNAEFSNKKNYMWRRTTATAVAAATAVTAATAAAVEQHGNEQQRRQQRQRQQVAHLH